MGMIDFLLSGRNGQLIGCWHLVRVEGTAHAPDAVELDFRRGGKLYQSIKNGSGWKVNNLSFHLDGSVMISSDHARTGIAFEPNGNLRLDSADNCSWYERGPKKAPEP